MVSGPLGRLSYEIVRGITMGLDGRSGDRDNGGIRWLSTSCQTGAHERCGPDEHTRAHDGGVCACVCHTVPQEHDYAQQRFYQIDEEQPDFVAPFPSLDHTETLRRACGHLEQVPVIHFLGESVAEQCRARIGACPCSQCLYPSVFLDDSLEESLENFPLYPGEQEADRLADLQTVQQIFAVLLERKRHTP